MACVFKCSRHRRSSHANSFCSISCFHRLRPGTCQSAVQQAEPQLEADPVTVVDPLPASFLLYLSCNWVSCIWVNGQCVWVGGQCIWVDICKRAGLNVLYLGSSFEYTMISLLLRVTALTRPVMMLRFDLMHCFLNVQHHLLPHLLFPSE
jgi:hypothetical protein